MKSAKRQDAILRYIQHQEFVYVEELISVMKVSGATIRRDLSVLEQQGKIIREYGKVRYRSEPASIKEASEPSVQKKKVLHQEEKRRIAFTASSYVKEGDCLFLDSGTTPAALYEFLRDKKITIVTNNLLLVQLAQGKDKARIIFGAGEFDSQHCTTNGVLFLDLLDTFQFDLCFIGVSGIDLTQKICTCTSLEVAAIKKHAMHNSQHRYVLSDASKCNETGIVSFAKFHEFDAIFMDPIQGEVPKPIVFCDS